MIQEPTLDHCHNSCATHHWYTLCPKEHYIDPAKMRLLMLVNKWLATDIWLQVDPGSSDITGVKLWTERGNMLTNSSLVLSYCHTTNGTHRNIITPHESCHTHMTLGLYPHSHTLKPQLCSSSTIIIPHASCNPPINIFHLKYNFAYFIMFQL